MRRGTSRRQVTIARSADEVWAVVARADLLHHWFPGMVGCEVAGHQRTIHLSTGTSLTETILANDPTQRRFQYTLAGGFFSEHLGTIDVIEVDPDRTVVTYSSDVRPAAMALVLGGATEAALRELRRQLEAGAGPVLDAIARSPEEA